MPKQHSIAQRIRAVILLVSLIVLVATASAFVIYDAFSFRQDLLRNLTTLATVIAENSAAALVFENEKEAAEILSALAAERDIEAAVLFRTNSQVFAAYPKNIDASILPGRIERVRQVDGEAAVVMVPVIRERKEAGMLYVRSNLRALDERMLRYGAIASGVLMLSLAGAYFLSTLLQKRISRPILALTEAASKVAEREDYSVRAPKLTHDELGLLTDTFNRMLAETQEHQTRLKEQARLLDLSNDAIIVRDVNGRIQYWNRGAEDIYGWKREDVIGKTKEEVLHTVFPEGRERVFELLFREHRWAGELIQTRRDGVKIHVSTRWALDRDKEGRAASILVTDNDITEQKEAEEALRQTERQFRTLGDNIAHLAWMADAAGTVFWYNKRWYDYTGTSEEKMRETGWEQVIHLEHQDRVKAKWQQHLSSGESWEDTFPIRSRDGDYRWFLSRAFPLRDAHGGIAGWFGTNTDITEQKLSEEQLERKVQERTAKMQETIAELEAFSYSISHDMRSPLRAMQGYAQALLEDHKGKLEPEAQRYLDRIFRAAHRMDLLIQDVLAYSRVSKGEIALHPVNVEKLIEDILVSQPEFQEPRARILVQKPLPAVRGHEAYLTQIITNLLGNAVKFVPEGVTPQIAIRAEDEGEYFRFWFEDNGIGIDPSHFDRIFQIFGQVYPEKKYGGTGIGLAIVRKAAQRMNGEVGVASALGEGSRFWVLLQKP